MVLSGQENTLTHSLVFTEANVQRRALEEAW